LISSWMVIEAIQKYMKKHLCISLLSDSVEWALDDTATVKRHHFSWINIK
jgi:hypothetical protein